MRYSKYYLNPNDARRVTRHKTRTRIITAKTKCSVKRTKDKG